MVSVLGSSEVYREFESRSGQISNYRTGICRFSAKHAAFGRLSKYCLAGIRIMCSRGAKFLPADCCWSEPASTKNKIKSVGLVQSGNNRNVTKVYLS